MRTMLRFLSRSWRPGLLVISLGLFAYLLYFYQLGSLLPGYAPAESQTLASAQSWRDLPQNPINAPYKLVMLLIASTGHDHVIITRLSAALFGALAVVVFFFVARAWYGFRAGLLGTILFATSSGFLHFARLGTPQILQMGIITIVGTLLWHRRSPHLHPYLTYLVVVLFGVLLYVPGMIWFEILVIALIHKRIVRHWNRTPTTGRIALPVLVTLLVTPLIISIARHSDLLMPVVGLPASFPGPTQIGRNLLDAVLAVGVRSDANPLFWLGHSPLLNAAELILGALGVYYYVYLRRTLYGVILASAAVLGIALATLGESIAYIIPILYLAIAGGIKHFLDEWLAVFPRNPIARSTGIIIVCSMLFFSSFYHMRSYFVAWPHNTATKQMFSLPRS